MGALKIAHRGAQNHAATRGQIEARFRDGMLHITVSKRESSKPRQIAVN